MDKDAELIGERVRALRHAQDLDAGVLAYKTGLSRANIYRIESGERPNAAAVTVGRLAQALGTSVEYLLGLTEDSSPPRFAQFPPSLAHQTRLRRFEERFARLSPEAQDAILDVLFGLLNYHRSVDHELVGGDGEEGQAGPESEEDISRRAATTAA